MFDRLRISFEGLHATLFGNATTVVDGEIYLKPPRLCMLTGVTGSGKTMILAIIAEYLGVPAFRAVKRIEAARLSWSGRAVSSAHLGIIRQDPASNFLGSSLGEEFELAYSLSRLNFEDFRRELEHYWAQHFDFDVKLLHRPPSRLSSGQQQVLALVSQILRKPDMILADEPLSRLSIVNARIAAQLLRGVAKECYVLSSSHLDALAPYREGDAQMDFFQIQNESGVMSVGELEAAIDIPNPDVDEDGLDEIMLDRVSYLEELDHSEGFASLPTSSPRTIKGSGERLTDQPLELDVVAGNRGAAVSVRGLQVAEGINILYGDNGSGKTLLGRAVGGDLTLNPRWRLGRSLYSRGPAVPLNPRAAGDEVPAGADLKWLHRARKTHFLSSDPMECLGGGHSVEDEIRIIYSGEEEVAARLAFLQAVGINGKADIDTLSYGQSKLVSFSLLPERASVVILDELFANLSKQGQSLIASTILERARARTWSVVILTSNRPLLTINHLQHVAEL